MLAGWSQQKIITTDPNAVDETLSDFTICIVLTSANFDFSLARSDGYDIRFTSYDGDTLFEYERVSHDATAELAEYHFRVLPLTDNNVFRMFYGKPDAPDVADKEAAWGDNDVMVQHMNDDPDTSHISDSTSNDNDGTKKGANEPIEAAGKVGKAQSFDNVDDYIAVPYMNIATVDFTFEALIKPLDTGINHIFSDWHNPHAFRFWADTGLNLQLRNPGGGDIFSSVVKGTINIGEWQYVAVTWDRSLKTATFYIEGVPVGTITSIHPNVDMMNNDRDYHIGWKEDSSDFFNGLIDESRISFNIARSATWIKANHHNLNGTLFTMTDASREAISLGGSMTPSGGITQISNPEWIAIDDRLRWLGEWDAMYVYAVGDVVMYKTAEGRYHGWLSRTTHNVGNIPTTAYAHWARIIQAKWRK